MSRLIYADILRLKKSMAFKLSVISGVCLGLFTCIDTWRSIQKYGMQIDHVLLYFSFTNMIGIVLAAFISIYIGTEYSDGTIRNKIIIGHKRNSIYLSGFISCAFSDLAILLGHLAVMICVGILLLGFGNSDTVPLSIIGAYALDTLLLLVSYAAVFNLITRLNSSKANAAVICLLLTLAMFVIASYLLSRLSQPEIFDEINTNGFYMEATVNPDYISGIKRSIYQFIADILPAGQGFQISSFQSEHPWRLASYSVILTILSNLTGIFFFKRKNLN